MKTKTFWVKLALVVLMLLFIWGNSLLPATASSRESGFVLRFAEPVVAVLQRLLEGRGVSLSEDVVVRKLAHFSEYAVLGVLMLALLIRPGLRSRPAASAGLCLAAALLDEGIQLFSPGRGASLRDVALDFAGACVGIALAALIVGLLRAARNKTGKKAASEG